MLKISTFDYEGRKVAVGYYMTSNIMVPVAFYQNQLGFWTADNECGALPDEVFGTLFEAFLVTYESIRRVLG